MTNENEVMVDEESEYVFPFIERISEMGITNLYKDKNCQQRLFCDMANYGYKPDAKDTDSMNNPNMVQNMFNQFDEIFPTDPNFTANQQTRFSPGAAVAAAAALFWIV